MQEPDHNLIEYLLSLIGMHEDGTLPAAEKDEQSLRDLDTAYEVKEFIDEIPGGFLICRADGDERIIYANKALLKIFKCDTLSEFKRHTKNSFRGLVHPDDLQSVEKSIRDQIAGSRDALDYVEFRIIRKDGVTRWVEDFGHYVSSRAVGNVFYVFITDATEKITRRLSEQAALMIERNAKEQRLQNIIEEYDKERMLIRQEHLQRLEVIEGLSVTYDSILYADLDANKVLPYRLSTRLVHQFNKKLEERELCEFLDEYIGMWVHPDDRKMYYDISRLDYIRKTLAAEQTYYLNYRCVENGEVKHIQMRLVNVGDKEHVSQVVIGYRDVEEEVSREMKQKQILEEALKTAQLAQVAKDAFLSNVTHDMRTPLNAIFGYTKLAHKNPNDAVKYLDKIETAGKQILELVDRVLELSYLESQDFAVTETDCDVDGLARDVCDSARARADERNITFSIDCSAVKHTKVRADANKLRQVLGHIVGNAVKYNRDGGTVKLTVSEISKPMTEFALYTFAVEDNGKGMSQSVLEHVFEPFEREQTTTASGNFGSGLGLTIAKHLTELMGGTVTAESTPGKGSKFTVAISLRIAKGEAQSNEKSAATELDGKKILLVEDNEINLEIETEILEDLGFNIDTAVNGKIAVDTIENAPPDTYALVLMDIQMPVMDGREATRRIRALTDEKRSHIPIIALSANAFESDKRASLEAGMDAHLTKPIDIPVLLGSIHSVISRPSHKR